MLKEQNTSGKEESEVLIHQLREMRSNNQLKITEGSFDEDSDGRVELLFTETGNGNKWQLNGILSDEHGELHLSPLFVQPHKS